jgi:hypothetical protein
VNDELIGTEPVTREPVAPKRHRVRWYHVVVLGVAVLLCAAAIGFSTNQASDRDDESALRTDARAQLVDQRRATLRATTHLATERTEMKATLTEVEPLTTSLHEYSDLVAQHVDAVAAAHSIAMRLPDSVDEWNEAVDRANGLLTQMQAKAETILQQIDALRDRAQGQFAAAVSSR